MDSAVARCLLQARGLLKAWEEPEIRWLNTPYARIETRFASPNAPMSSLSLRTATGHLVQTK